MSGYIDAAVCGVCITEPALKTSAKGTPWTRVLLAVGEGNGKQFAWVCCFGQDAERVVAALRKGSKFYAEGELSSEIYERDGKPAVSLSIKARRIEVLNTIGKARPKQERRDDGPNGSRHPQHGEVSAIVEAACAVNG
jgi:single-stranded DNA-binding protein